MRLSDMLLKRKWRQCFATYVTSTFFAHTSTNDLQKMVNNVIESSNISAQKMASLSTDGPNIKKALHKRLDEKMKEGHPGLVPFDPSVLH